MAHASGRKARNPALARCPAASQAPMHGAASARVYALALRRESNTIGRECGRRHQKR